MTETIPERCETWQVEMDRAYPDRLWLRILEAFLPSGAADARQLCQAVGLERDQMRRPLKKLEAYGVGSQAILRRFEQTLVRPGGRGRTPNVYLLGKVGAVLLRFNGHETTRVCALKDKYAVLHALCMEDVHLAALRCERQIITDQTISYDDNKALRPDHQVTLSDGRKILIEVEQIARPQLVRRISDSLRHKQAFFISQMGAMYLPQVRMLVGLPRGRDWFRTPYCLLGMKRLF